MTYPLRSIDKPVIDAAMALGGVLLDSGRLDEEQTAAVRALRQALARLPEVDDPALDAEYSLTAIEGASVIAARLGQGPWAAAHGRIRTWGVAMGPHGLAVYSIHTPVPPADPFHDGGLPGEDEELDFFLAPDGQPFAGDTGFEAFEAGVAALPDLFMAPDGALRLEIQVRQGPPE